MNLTLVYPSLKGRKILDEESLLTLLKTEKGTYGIRELRATPRIERDKLPEPYLSKIPYLLFSGVYRNKSGKQTLDKYTGQVLLEVNRLKSWEEAEQVRNYVGKLPSVSLAFIGLSGLSVKFLVRFSLPDGSLPIEEQQINTFHESACMKALDYFEMQLDHTVTIRTESPDCACRLSLDPDLIYNPYAVPVIIDHQSGQRSWKPSSEDKGKTLDNILAGRSYEQRLMLEYSACVKNTLEQLNKETQNDFPLLRYEYLALLAQNCFKAGIEEETAVYKTLLQEDLKPCEQEVRDVFRSVYEVTKLFGSKSALKACQHLAFGLDHFFKRRFDFRFNELTNGVEYRSRALPYGKFSLVTDRILNSMIRAARKEGLDVWDRDVKRFINSADIPDYNPIDFFLKTLPEWDGKDHIRTLAATVPVEDAEIWQSNFYTWFLGMVAGWQQKNKMHGNSTLPLLIGEQACGKSTFCKRILPPELQVYYTDSIDFTKKQEAMLCLTRYLLINIDEFDSVSSSYQSFLKHVIQKPVVNVRKPFETTTKMNRRYSSFVATCNNEDILSDPTGSRRYLCSKITGRVNNEAVIDYPQLYAQAVAALNRGETYWFDVEHAKQTTDRNQAFNQLTIEENLLLHYFEVPGKEGQGEWMSPTEIFLYIQKESKMKLGNKGLSAFGRILKKHGFIDKRIRTGTVYLVNLK
ncbi:MAG: VapE domain-containing protein [Bacteroidales bacterium]